MAPPSPTVAETLRHLQEQIEALALKQEEYFRIQAQEKSDNDEEDNPFAEHDENKVIIIEHGLIPDFHGRQTPAEFLDWIVTVEDILELKRVPLDQRVDVIEPQFRGSTAAWWTQLNVLRARLGKPRILSWGKLKKKMRKRYLPMNYEREMFQRLHKLQQGKRSVEEYSTEFFWLLRRVDLQDSDRRIAARFISGLRQQKMKDTLDLLKPLTLAQTHKKALLMEAQIKANIWRKRAEDVTLCWCLTGIGLATAYLSISLVVKVVRAVIEED